MCKSFFLYFFFEGGEKFEFYTLVSLLKLLKDVNQVTKTFYIKLISLKNCHIQKITLNRSQREQGKIKHISIAKQESKTQNDKNEKQ